MSNYFNIYITTTTIRVNMFVYVFKRTINILYRKLIRGSKFNSIPISKLSRVI